jgi:hypothetical protein
VLPEPGEIHEAEVNGLDFFFTQESE